MRRTGKRSSTVNKALTVSRSLYASLDLGDDTQKIRVLDLERNTVSEEYFRHKQPLRGTLRVVSLNQAPQFTALSYVWGAKSSQGSRRTIQCNNREVEITENCGDALFSLRERFGNVTIWVDSICINQDDTKERNHQVKLMGLVYSQARYVFIWLGHDMSTEDCDTPEKRWFNTNDGLLLLKHLCLVDSRDSYRIKRGLEMSNLQIEALLQNQWFHRGWTFQELILASNPVLITSTEGVNWVDICRAIKIMLPEQLRPKPFQLSNEAREASTPHIMGLISLVGVWNAISPSAKRADRTTASITYDQNLACCGIIQSLRTRIVSEPKDRAYALYGVLLALDVQLTSPDYSKSICRIYRDLFVDLLHWRCITLILLIDAGYKHNNDEPSWVPHWGHPDTAWIAQDVITSAIMNESTQWGPPVIRINELSLHVSGYSLGIVQNVFPVPRKRYDKDQSSAPEHESLMETIAWLRTIFDTLDCLYLRKTFPYVSTRWELFLELYEHVNPFLNLGVEFPSAFEAWLTILFNATFDDEENCTWDKWSLTGENSYQFCKHLFDNEEAKKFQTALETQAGGRRAIFTTSSGQLGIGPYEIRAGDHAYCISSIPLPFLLRPISETSLTFTVVGSVRLVTKSSFSWLGPSVKMIELV